MRDEIRAKRSERKENEESEKYFIPSTKAVGKHVARPSAVTRVAKRTESRQDGHMLESKDEDTRTQDDQWSTSHRAAGRKVRVCPPVDLSQPPCASSGGILVVHFHDPLIFALFVA